jgi:hypothetical protein
MGLTLNANCNVVHEVDNVFRCSRRRHSRSRPRSSSRTRATRFSRSPLLQHNCVTSSRTWTSIRGEHDKCWRHLFIKACCSTSWSLIFYASGVSTGVITEHPSSSPLPLIRRGLRKIGNKLTAIELLRLQKRNMRSCRDTLRPRTCQCRTQVHTSSAKIIKFLFYCYLRHGGAWSRARLRLSRLKWCLRRVEEYNLDVEFGVGPPHAPLRLREI